MVAAAGEEGALSPAVAWSLLGSFLAILFFTAYFTRFSTDIGLATEGGVKARPIPKR